MKELAPGGKGSALSAKSMPLDETGYPGLAALVCSRIALSYVLTLLGLTLTKCSQLALGKLIDYVSRSSKALKPRSRR